MCFGYRLYDCGDRFDYDEDGYDNVDDCNDGIAAINQVFLAILVMV